MTGLLIAICTVALLGAVVFLVSAPLRAAENERIERGDVEPESAPALALATDELRREDLQAARAAKYREIRDAELDFRTGKLSAADYETIDTELRAEAVTILDALERLEADEGAEVGAPGLGPGALQQDDRVHEEENREEDRPAV